MTQQARHLAKILAILHARWQPHKTQALPIVKVFGQGAQSAQVECGRKWGKTEEIEYFLTRGGMTRPGGWYYFAPEQKQAKEIVWASGRFQKFIPPEWIGSINNTEMRITLCNGAFIKVDGSDNIEAYRGIEPHGAAYDEYKDFRPEFHRAFSPNFAVYQALLLICGTPPETDLEHYDQMVAEHKAAGCYFNFPSWANPHLDRDWLRKEKAKLYARGEGDVWEREYAARRVRGGKASIFPMFDPERHVRPHAELVAEIERDRHKLQWQVICDPGSASVFAVLFRAINPYTKKVYNLGEIYEKEQANTSVSKIIPRIKAMRDELFPSWAAHGIDWQQIYDEAATWFQTEAAQEPFNEYFFPTKKSLADKTQGLSYCKDQLLHGLTVFSDRCTSIIQEVHNYIRDANNKPVKAGDHLIDCWRYGNHAAGLSLAEEAEPKAKDPDQQKRFVTPESDFEARRREQGKLSVDDDLFIDQELMEEMGVYD